MKMSELFCGAAFFVTRVPGHGCLRAFVDELPTHSNRIFSEQASGRVKDPPAMGRSWIRLRSLMHDEGADHTRSIPRT